MTTYELKSSYPNACPLEIDSKGNVKKYSISGFEVTQSTYGNATQIDGILISSFEKYGSDRESTRYYFYPESLKGLGLTENKSFSAKTIASVKNGNSFCDLRGCNDTYAETIYIDVK